MRVLLGSLAVALVVTPARAQDRTADEAAVRSRVAALANTLNRGDAAGYAALFTPDGDFIGLDSPRIQGRTAIQAARAKVMAAAPNVRATITPIEIRFVGSDIAIVNTVARFTDGTATSEDRGTFVLHRESGGWLITALRVMPAAKP